MKVLLILPLALLVVAEPLTQRERDYAMSALHASRKALVDAAGGLSEAQVKFKAGPDRWSIAEITEHLADTEPFLFGFQQGLLKQPAASAEKKALVKGKDEGILKSVAAREQKVQAPPQLAPKSKFATVPAAIDAFHQARMKTIRYVESSGDAMRDHVAENFGPGQAMDAYQLLLMLAAHTDRHVAQIQEVKAAPGFPKK